MNKEDIINIINKGESETVEFKSSFSKSVIETIVAFSNTEGGNILIGINDRKETIDISITDETIQKWINEIKQNTSPQVIPYVDVFNIDNKNIVALNVIEYPIKPVSYKDKFYKRVLNSNHKMSLTEVTNEHLRTINGSWDYFPDPNHTLEHISLQKVEKYIKEYRDKNDTSINYSAINFLNKQEILKDGKLTFGAYLLFAKELCIISDVQVGRFKGSTKIIDSLSLDTDIFTELDEILTFIKKNLMVEFIITGNAAREERYDYPLKGTPKN